jgi:hypothetical protein
MAKKRTKTNKRRRTKNGGDFGALIPPALLLGTRQYLLKNKSLRKTFKKRFF